MTNPIESTTSPELRPGSIEGSPPAVKSGGDKAQKLIRDPGESLIEAFKNEKIVLFAGAGLNLPALVPSWERLLAELIEDAKLMHGLEEREVDSILGLDVYAKAGIIKKYLGGHYVPMLQKSLYKNKAALAGYAERFIEEIGSRGAGALLDPDFLTLASGDSCPLLLTMSLLCVVVNIHAIVTYNYDTHAKDTIDRVYSQGAALGRPLKPIKTFNLDPHHFATPCFSAEGDARVLPIYHVHGFVYPPDSFRGGESEVVFAQDEYFRVMNAPFSWQTINQLYFLMNYTCVFLGCSLTDVNILRLVSIARERGASGRIYNITSKHALGGSDGAITDRFRMMAQKEAGINVVVAGDGHSDTRRYIFRILKECIEHADGKR